MEKILICAPTASVKNYCAIKWLSNINKFTYPNFEVVVFDNTPDNGENSEWLNRMTSELCVNFDFKAIWLPFKKDVGTIERLSASHNQCRKYACENGFKHMLHLETDVLPEPNIIETLLAHKKQVVGGLYYRDEGRSRKLMVQKHIFRSSHNIKTVNIEPYEDVCFIDGTLKKVAHIGLGCVMIHNSIFAQIPFRFIPDINVSPDSYFAEDCFKHQIPIYADTATICQHLNTPWGKFGEDYN